MPTGPHEPDHGTGPAGPLGHSTKPVPDADEGWRTEDPSKPWLQRNQITGRYRTTTYQPTTPLRD